MSKRIVTGLQIATNLAMGTGTITTAIFDAHLLDQVNIKLVWTGTPTGVFTVQYIAADGDTTWTTIPLDTAVNCSGAAGSNFIDLLQANFYKVQVQYVGSSGTGTLNAWVNAKTVGH